MQNIIDYVENSFLTFDEKPPTRVDSLVFSALSYLEYEVIFKEYIEKSAENEDSLSVAVDNSFYYIKDEFGKFVQLYFYDFLNTDYYKAMSSISFDSDNLRKLLKAVTKSPRFRSVRLCFYLNKFDKKLEMQFAAITFILSNNSSYVAFRGTDQSLVGWKEDFNMAYTCPVPAQSAAAVYLNAVAPYLPGTIYVGGHSKGGNLAVYSLMKAENGVAPRIKTAFSHDGPGFKEEVVESEEFQEIVDKVNKTVPQDSIVGMLLQSHEKYQVIKSSGKFIGQHDPFTWEIKNGDFITLESITKSSELTDSAVSTWVENMTDEKRHEFIDELFRILSASKASSFDYMKKNIGVSLGYMTAAVLRSDPETRGMMLTVLKDLAAAFKKNIFDNVKEE